MKCLEFSWIPYAALYLQSSRRSCYSSTWAIGWHWHSSRAFHFPPFSSLFFCRRMMQVAPSQGYGYGSYGYTKGNGLNGIDFLSGDFDIGIDGDLLTAGIAAAAAAFFFLTYGAITAGKKRKKRSVEDDNQIQSGFWPNWIMGKLKIDIYIFKILVLWVFCVSTQEDWREKNPFIMEKLLFLPWNPWRAIMHVNQAARAYPIQVWKK